MFYVDTVLKLTECTTDTEAILQQVISAAPDNFWKIKFSSDPEWIKCIFLEITLKDEGCITGIEILLKQIN